MIAGRIMRWNSSWSNFLPQQFVGGNLNLSSGLHQKLFRNRFRFCMCLLLPPIRPDQTTENRCCDVMLRLAKLANNHLRVFLFSGLSGDVC